MQADRTGSDDGEPYVATCWRLGHAPERSRRGGVASGPRTVLGGGRPFHPQLSSCTNFEIILPPPPPVGLDPGISDVWDQALWDQGHWDTGVNAQPIVRNGGWVSIGITGFTHAAVVQTTVAQQARPQIEMIAVDATFERLGVNV